MLSVAQQGRQGRMYEAGGDCELRDSLAMHIMRVCLGNSVSVVDLLVAGRTGAKRGSMRG